MGSQQANHPTKILWQWRDELGHLAAAWMFECQKSCMKRLPLEHRCRPGDIQFGRT